MDRVCVWCDKHFRLRATKNQYGLELSGVDICYVCSDLWQDEMLKLHSESVKGWLDPTRTKIITENGHVLPVRLGSWRNNKLSRGLRADAVDTYGGNWHAGLRNELVTLKPRR